MNIEKFLIDNPNVKAIIDSISDDSLYSEVQRGIKTLDEHLFSNCCMKGYLKECEPFYCTFRNANNCDYIKLLKYIKEKYRIDIVERKINNE